MFAKYLVKGGVGEERERHEPAFCRQKHVSITRFSHNRDLTCKFNHQSTNLLSGLRHHALDGPGHARRQTRQKTAGPIRSQPS